MTGTMKLKLTKEEQRAFAIVDEILKTLQDCGEEYRVMSLKNGDCVDFSELARVRGILGCLSESDEFKVTRKATKCEDACDCGCCEECNAEDNYDEDYYDELVSSCLKQLFGF